ncbi:MAG: hypothetical protein IJ716_02920 [Lachnospiraceae bacterium]|nr:hypothetical protein [Lachnospiraceae bacterium]
MSANTKIVVLHMKELIYTAVFAVLAILIILLMVILFLPDQKDENTPQDSVTPQSNHPAESDNASTVQVNASVGTYIPGVYTTELVLGGQTVDVEVIVSQETISSIRLANPSESVYTVYPLLEPTLESISDQIYETQSLSGITYSADNKYTSLILLEAIRNSLNKAHS